MPVGKTGVDLKDFEKIDWDSLTFANNYIFLEVMNNKKRCQYLIEKVLHIPIKQDSAHCGRTAYKQPKA